MLDGGLDSYAGQDSPNPGARTCREAFAVLEEEQPHEPNAVLLAKVIAPETPRMIRVRVHGDTAVVTCSDGDERRLRKIHGRWLIDSY